MNTPDPIFENSASAAPPTHAAPGLRSVTLIDPFAGGHHVPYAVMLCQQFRERGLEVNLIGPARLVSEVCAQAPVSRSAVLELYQGSTADYHRKGKWHEERSSYLFTRRALDIARSWNSDIAHFVFLDSFILSLLAARILGGRAAAGNGAADRMRLFTTLHWAYMLPRFQEPGLTGRLKAAAQLWGLRRLLRSGVHLQLHTPSFVSEIGQGGPPGQVSYIPYPAETPSGAGPEQVAALRAHLGVSPEVKLLLAFGGTRRNKGADVAVMTLAHLPQQYHLMIMGAQEHFSLQALSELADRLGVRERVHLNLKYIEREEYDPYFAAAAAALLPYRQGFSGQSGVMFIAGSAGVPVVASAAGSTGELVERFGLGVVVQSTDEAEELARNMAGAVQALLAVPVDQDLREQRRRQFLQIHSLENFADCIVRDYALSEKTVSEKNGPPTSTIRHA